MYPEVEAPHNKTAAFSQFPRCPQYNMEKEPAKWQCVPVPREQITIMGYSIRVADARYTEWRLWHNCNADWSSNGIVAKELYDHSQDSGLGVASFDEFEFQNLAYDPSRQKQVADLALRLAKQFSGSGARC